MESLNLFFDYLFSSVNGGAFAVLALTDLCAFAAVYLAAIVATLCSRRVRAASKRVFFHLANLFAAVTLAAFATAYPLSNALFAAVMIWCAGYALYGLLCALSAKGGVRTPPAPLFSQMPSALPREELYPEVPAAKNTVRLEHALSIADRLLARQLGRGDRQELEKMKTELTVLKVKGEFSPRDGELLNDSFNALLKMMAKYNL